MPLFILDIGSFPTLINGLNRREKAGTLAKTYEPAKAAYRSTNAEDKLGIASEATADAAAAKWLLDNLKK